MTTPAKDHVTKARRIKPRHVYMLKAALEHFILRFSIVEAQSARRARRIIDALPAHAPYELRLFAHEWEILSRALRPTGSTPTAGGRFAQWFALYTLLRKTFVFPRPESAQRGKGVRHA